MVKITAMKEKKREASIADHDIMVPELVIVHGDPLRPDQTTERGWTEAQPFLLRQTGLLDILRLSKRLWCVGRRFRRGGRRRGGLLGRTQTHRRSDQKETQKEAV